MYEKEMNMELDVSNNNFDDSDYIKIPEATTINVTVSPEEVKDIAALYDANLSINKTVLLSEYDDTKKIRQQKIYEFKLKQGYLYMRDIMILNIIAFMEMILFMILSMLIWLKFTSFSGEDYIRFILTAGVVAEILIYMLNEKFIKWFSRRRLSWIRKQIKNIK